MTNAGKKTTQKRGSAPTSWPIERKVPGRVWVPKIAPGPHPKESSIPLLLLLRDVLQIGTSKSEITKILTNRNVKVDGRIRTNEHFPVGHMDVVELVKEERFFRIQIHTSHKVSAFEIEPDRADYKVCKVIGKRNVKGGDFQLSLHDGRNILLDADDDMVSKIKGQYSLKIGIPSQEIMDIYPLEEGARATVTEGRHQGKIGEILEINRRYGPKASEVIFEDKENEEEPEFRTALDYVFVVGDELEYVRGDI